MKIPLHHNTYKLNFGNISSVTGPILTKFPGTILNRFQSSHNDICPGNICPCDICPYKEYLKCYQPNFGQTLNVKFIGPSLTDAILHGAIWPGNFCPGDICAYQEYLSCYWSNFDQTFWTQLFLCLYLFGSNWGPPLYELL